MKAVTGVFASPTDANRAVEALRAKGVPTDKITVLSPRHHQKEAESIPVDATEQPGIGKAIGAVVGGAGGFTGGSLLLAAVIPGVGPVTALGLLGAAILGAAGATVGAACRRVARKFDGKGSTGRRNFRLRRCTAQR
jgi:hypothetical protein